MGNNRLALKENVTKDLQSKIDTTTITINKLRVAVTSVDKSAMEAKSKVQKAVDSVIEQLVARKLELNRQIDGLCQAQTLSLQESIESAYLRLGNLQSTLSNLDSYDGNQLVNLRVPEASRALSLPLGPPLNLQVDTSVISEELKKWNAMSTPEPLKDKCDSSPLSATTTTSVRKTDVATNVSKSSRIGGLQPLFPENFLGIVREKRESVSNIQKEPKDSQIELWLSGMKIANSTASDDTYEFLSETEPILCLDSVNVCSPTNDRKLSECEDGSSIVCVEMDAVEQEDDMSKWLKPRKKRNCSSLSDVTNNVYLHKSETSSKYRSLDFPCLRSDPDSWVPKRKKNSLSISARSQQMCFQVGQTEIIPPTYALPYPFWLKK